MTQYMTTPDFLEYLKKQKGSRMQRLQILSEMLAESKRPRYGGRPRGRGCY